MKISDHCTIGSSSAAKGFKKDAKQRDMINYCLATCYNKIAP